ncbi:MAG: alpha/beta fold hydrolase [Bacteroidota bacterium]
MKEIRYKDVPIAYSEFNPQGETVLVLLHGYLESSEIFTPFIEKLDKRIRVLAMDLPGHGRSDVLPEDHSMESMAEALQAVLKAAQVTNCWIAGHSMGGYVALAFAQAYPEMGNGLCLLHSHPFADSETVKQKRMREIALVEHGKKELIAQSNIPNAFADENLEKLHETVKGAIEIALQTPAEGIIANLKAMKNRNDSSSFLKRWAKPFLLILGKNDKYIDYNSLFDRLELPEQAIVVSLEESGHMGFVEESEAVAEVLEKFCRG